MNEKGKGKGIGVRFVVVFLGKEKEMGWEGESSQRGPGPQMGDVGIMIGALTGNYPV